MSQKITYNMNAYSEDGLPLRDVAFRCLREAILTGQLQPGERLREIELSNQMGVSRTPLREALRMLEHEGLVLMYPRRGACVANISEKDLKDVLEVRRVLEDLTMELACRNCTPELIRQLRIKNLEIEQAVRKKDVRMIAQKDVEFHDIIYEIADNHKLTQIISNLREQIYRFRLEYVKEEAKREQIIREHKTIIQEMEAGRIEEARAAMRDHIKNQEIGVWMNLKQEK